MSTSNKPPANADNGHSPLIIMSVAVVAAIVAIVGAVFEIGFIISLAPLGFVGVTLAVALLAFVAWQRNYAATRGTTLFMGVAFVVSGYICFFAFCGAGILVGDYLQDENRDWAWFGVIGGAVGVIAAALLLIWLQRRRKPSE